VFTGVLPRIQLVCQWALTGDVESAVVWVYDETMVTLSTNESADHAGPGSGRVASLSFVPGVVTQVGDGTSELQGCVTLKKRELQRLLRKRRIQRTRHDVAAVLAVHRGWFRTEPCAFDGVLVGCVAQPRLVHGYKRAIPF